MDNWMNEFFHDKQDSVNLNKSLIYSTTKGAHFLGYCMYRLFTCVIYV